MLKQPKTHIKTFKGIDSSTKLDKFLLDNPNIHYVIQGYEDNSFIKIEYFHKDHPYT